MHVNYLVRTRRFLQIAAIGALLAAPALAQFSSGSDGSDGDLDLSLDPNDVVVFDPVARGIDPEGDNVFHFQSITIPVGKTLVMRPDKLQFSPVFFLATGPVDIQGTIDLSGADGHPGTASAHRVPSMPGPGGFPGGVGSSLDSDSTGGFGPGGAPAVTSNGRGGGGGHARNGATGNGPGGAAYGNLFLLPLIGGSGGAGGGRAGSIGGGGGAGGGALLIASDLSIDIDGTIDGRGGDSNSSLGRGGGTGAGGGIRLLAPDIRGTGVITTAGGLGTGTSRGSDGRVRLESFQRNFTGTITGVSRVVTLAPNAIILPATDAPAVRVTAVAGVPAPPQPTGSFLTPDITINQAVSVLIELEAHNIPLGTTVTLRLFSETGGDQITTSFPLAGTFETSTALAKATFPHGFSLAFISASWTP